MIHDAIPSLTESPASALLATLPLASLWRLADRWDQDAQRCRRRGDEACFRRFWQRANAAHVELNRRECLYRAAVAGRAA